MAIHGATAAAWWATLWGRYVEEAPVDDTDLTPNDDVVDTAVDHDDDEASMQTKHTDTHAPHTRMHARMAGGAVLRAACTA